MKRRTFLGAWSAIGLGSMSGCIGGGDETATSPSGNSPNGGESTQETIEEIKTEEPALELRDTHIEQETVEYGDEFTISATLANVGRKPIRANNLNSAPEFAVNYAESDRVFDKNSQRDAGDIELDSNTITTITLGPFDAAVSGTWNVEAGRYIDFIREGAETTFDVQPRRLSTGQSVPLLHGVSMTVERIHLLDSFFAEYVPRRADLSNAVGLETAPEGTLFVVPELRIRNDGLDFLDVGSIPQEYRLGTSQFTVAPADPYHPSEQTDQRGFRLPGKPLKEASLNRGETGTARLLRTVDIAQWDELVLEFDKWENTGPPEARVEISDSAYPVFELVEFVSPDRWEDRPQRFGAVVENVGTAPGTFRGIVQYQGFDTEAFVDPRLGNELERVVKPGETVEVTTEYDLESGVRYRLQPFDETIRL